MADPKSDGRMIRKDISNSDKYASLRPEAAVLFAMLIPHFSAHGKLNGGPGYIKDEVCPKIPYLTYENIPEFLAEIDQKTNVKWFKSDGRYWLHSINFLSDHQKLDHKKLGRDLLPTYSGLSPEQVPPEVEVEVEVEVERKGKSGLEREENQETLNAQAEHSWQAFKIRWPLRNGKFIDEDECRAKWARSPAMWAQWLSCEGNYIESREVAEGFAMNAMKFLSKSYRNWFEKEKPLGETGHGKQKSAPRDFAAERQDLQRKRMAEATERLFAGKDGAQAAAGPEPRHVERRRDGCLAGRLIESTAVEIEKSG